jgi:hypothetical protein
MDNLSVEAVDFRRSRAMRMSYLVEVLRVTNAIWAVRESMR